MRRVLPDGPPLPAAAAAAPPRRDAPAPPKAPGAPERHARRDEIEEPVERIAVRVEVPIGREVDRP